MSETFWDRNRAAIILGILGFGVLGILLFLFVLFIAGMSHCSQCDMSPWLLRGFGLSFLLAALFGVAVGFAAAGLRTFLTPFLGVRVATALLSVLTIGLAALAAYPGMGAILYVEHRIERAKDEARLEQARDLCPDRSQHLAIIHDELPRPLPRDTFVAEVRFRGTDVTPLYQGGADAEVLRVIQGDPAIRELRVERVQQSTRCDEAFENGREGLVVVIPKELPRGNLQKVEAVFARRGEGYRVPDGFQIEEWQRPYWLAQPKVHVAPLPPGSRVVTQAENGIATTSISAGEPIVVNRN
jgi:hypothetical protein